jgi:hypothetical protein
MRAAGTTVLVGLKAAEDIQECCQRPGRKPARLDRLDALGLLVFGTGGVGHTHLPVGRTRPVSREGADSDRFVARGVVWPGDGIIAASHLGV